MNIYDLTPNNLSTFKLKTKINAVKPNLIDFQDIPKYINICIRINII